MNKLNRLIVYEASLRCFPVGLSVYDSLYSEIFLDVCKIANHWGSRKIFSNFVTVWQDTDVPKIQP